MTTVEPEDSLWAVFLFAFLFYLMTFLI